MVVVHAVLWLHLTHVASKLDASAWSFCCSTQAGCLCMQPQAHLLLFVNAPLLSMQHVLALSA
jgi:hypothetical protein